MKPMSSSIDRDSSNGSQKFLFLFSALSRIGLKNLKAKLFVGGLLLILTCIATIAAVSYYGVKGAISSASQLEQIADLTGQTVDLLVFENIQFAKSIATDPTVIDRAERAAGAAERQGINGIPTANQTKSLEEKYLPVGALNVDTELNSLLRHKRGIKSVFERLFFTDRYGLVVGSTSATEDFVQSDELWWNEAMRTGLYLEDLTFDKPSGRWAVGLCVAVPHPRTGQPNGVLRVRYNLLDAQDYFAKFYQHRSGYGYVVGNDGRYILHPNPSLWNEPIADSLGRAGFQANVSSATGGVLNYKGANPNTQKEETRIAAFAVSKGLNRDGVAYSGFGWIVVVDNSFDEVYAPVFTVVGRLGIAGVALFIVLSAVAFLLSLTFSGIVRNLLDATERIREGNLDARVHIRTGDELERVGDGFNLMMDR
jgi:hypothetical protein